MKSRPMDIPEAKQDTIPSSNRKRIGVLACQGAFAEHFTILRRLGASASTVRLPRDLEGLDGLVIPGGESTTISRLMREYDLIEPVIQLSRQGRPIMGTCAGTILLASKVSDSKVTPLALMDIEVKRNAFGRQMDSFEADIEIPVIGEAPFHSVFIRAPSIVRCGEDVQVLARLPDGTGVAVRQANMIALAFHPELTDDTRIHSYFLSMVNGDIRR